MSFHNEILNMMHVAGATSPQDPLSIEKISSLMKEYLLSSTRMAIQNNISSRTKVMTPNNYIGPITITPTTEDILSSIFMRIHSLSNKDFNIKLAQRFMKFISWKMEKKSKNSGPLCGGGGVGEEEDLEILANSSEFDSSSSFSIKNYGEDEEGENVLDDSIFTKEELEDYISIPDVPFSSIIPDDDDAPLEHKRSHRKKNLIISHFNCENDVDLCFLGIAECILGKVWNSLLLLSSLRDWKGALKVERYHFFLYSKLSTYLNDENRKKSSIVEFFDDSTVNAFLIDVNPLCDLSDRQRIKRMDDIAKSLKKDEYVLWSEARQSNFSTSLKSKNGKKFREFLNLPNLVNNLFTNLFGNPTAMTVRFTDDFYAALSHLGFEIVNLLVEFALDLQKKKDIDTSPLSIGVCNIFNRMSGLKASNNAHCFRILPQNIKNIE